MNYQRRRQQWIRSWGMTVKANCVHAKARHGFQERDNSYSQADETGSPSSTGQDQPDNLQASESAIDDTTLWMRIAERTGSLDFWLSPDEDVYTEDDGTPI
jgi:hypothetical protein